MTLQSNVEPGLDIRRSSILFLWYYLFESPKGLQLQILSDSFLFPFAINPLFPDFHENVPLTYLVASFSDSLARMWI